MDAEEVLKLYDSCWFELKILEENSSSRITSSSLSDPHHKMDQESSEPKLLRIKTTHTRSLSDQLSSITTFNKHDTFSPNSVLQADLQTIISGKQVTDPQVKETARENLEVSPSDHKGTARRRRKKRANKSLSDLEFEELKGFMDLGFVFSEEDKDSSLASIIPGLSEAWQVLDKQKKQSSLMNWRVPALNKEIDMKDSLRWWAHTVASTLK